METLSNHITKEELKEELWKLMETVYDPEIPVLSVVDLGIVRDIQINENEIKVIITPTYSGCPAMDVITTKIKVALIKEGFPSAKVIRQISPAWTTDWMSQAGKDKLKSYGIAPPSGKTFDKNYLENLVVQCPLCHSKNTKLVSQFGSTACKALYQCLDCREPFDYFKCH